MKIWIILAIAVLASLAVFIAVRQFGKRKGMTDMIHQAALIAGLAGGTVFLMLSCRQLITTDEAVTIVLINAIFPLVGVLICLLQARSLLRYRIPLTLAVVAAYIVICTATMLGFLYSEGLLAIVKAGLFVIGNLLWIFPLAALMLTSKRLKAS